MGDRLTDADLAGIDMDAVAAIVNAKESAGDDAYLWAHSSGDVILWESEEQSEDNDGSHAIDRWQVDEATLAGLHNWIDDLY
jgi:hypothetical protein